MATLITKHRTSTGVPSSLAQGELAVNTSDKKLYVGGAGGSSVVDLQFETVTNDLTVEKANPVLILDHTTDIAGAAIIGKIQCNAETSSATWDDVGSIHLTTDTYWTSSAYTNWEFFTQNGVVGSADNEVAKFYYDGRIYFPNVYADTVTSARDLEINSSGQIGYVSSTRESKTNITDLTDVSWLYNLNAVTFNHKDFEEISEEDGTQTKVYLETHQADIEYGLVAEDAESINSDLCFYNDEGKLEGVHYKKLITPLVKVIQEQKDLIDALTTRITALES